MCIISHTNLLQNIPLELHVIHECAKMQGAGVYVSSAVRAGNAAKTGESTHHLSLSLISFTYHFHVRLNTP